MTMMERVAKAIYCVDADRCTLAHTGKGGTCEDCLAAAKRAIAAMSEPTTGMLGAGYTLCVGTDNMDEIYKCMIEAALK